MIEWIEKQIGRFINFLSDAKEDIAEIDDKFQDKIIEYRNKQCGKAAIFGVIIGVIGTLAFEAILRVF